MRHGAVVLCARMGSGDSGNFSVRDSGAGAHSDFAQRAGQGQMTPADLLEMDLEGRVVDGDAQAFGGDGSARW